jgi:Animal haem peroxidase
LNTATHTLDLDIIYNHENVQTALEHGGLFPHNDFDIRNIILGGSDRAGMMPQIFAIVEVWIKYHNIVFAHLRQLHPHHSDEVLFYETRRFVIAVYQSVLYNEVMRFILSTESQNKYKLVNIDKCFNANVEPAVSAEFVSSVARYFHTFIQNEYSIRFKNGSVAIIPLRHLTNNLDLIEVSSIQGIIQSLLKNPWNTESIASEPSNYLFTANDNPGLDLHAMDFQAERDFGIGTYCDALYELNMTEGGCIKNFKHLERFIDKEHIAMLKYAYEHPCDVDLGVAGGLISSNNHNILSPVFEALFARQFFNLKCGDPYFFTNSLSEGDLLTYKQDSYHSNQLNS